MIRVTPTNDAGRVCAFLADNPEGATVADIAAALCPYPHPKPLLPECQARVGKTAGYRLWEAEHAVWVHLAGVHAEIAHGVALRLVQALARGDARLVALRGPLTVCRVGARYVEAVGRMQADPTRAGDPPVTPWHLLACRALGLDAWEYSTPGAPVYAQPEPAALARCMQEVHECPTLATSQKPSAWRATFARAVRLGLIVAPSLRVLTGTGRALVAAWRA